MCRRNRGWRASQAWMTGALCVARLSRVGMQTLFRHVGIDTLTAAA